MKILVLGGGDMGSGVAEVLCGYGVGEVVVGDIDISSAESVVRILGREGCGVRALRVDALSLESLREASRGVDVVVNTVGPFYKYGFRIARNLIEIGLDFVDICDDYDATEKILGLDEEASRRGLRAVVGLGWTPGISNLLASIGARELGGVSAVDIYWVGSAADSRGLAVVMHLFYAMTGSVPMFIDGEMTRVEAGTGAVDIELPRPFGRLRLYYTGHPEPITLPRSLGVSRRVTVRGGLVPQWQTSLAKLLVKTTRGSPEGIERLAKTIHRIEGLFRVGGLRASAVRVDVERGLETRRYVAVGRMRRLTGAPAALGAVLLARGTIRTVGVRPPEQAIESPEEFLRELTRWGIEVISS